MADIELLSFGDFPTEATEAVRVVNVIQVAALAGLLPPAFRSCAIRAEDWRAEVTLATDAAPARLILDALVDPSSYDLKIADEQAHTIADR